MRLLRVLARPKLRLSRDQNGVLLSMRLKPRGRKNVITGVQSGVLQIEVSAPPVDDKANEVLLRVLVKGLGTAKSNLEIVSGAKSRDKTVRVLALDEDEIQQFLTLHGET